MRSFSKAVFVVAFLCGIGLSSLLRAQEGAPPAELPKGVEVQARGPVHEAFATPTAAHGATPLIPKRPPANVEELPPETKPAGDVVWIGGYWHWDDDRNDFLWVSGCWRAKPPGKDWIAGYWREQGNQWQWVPGFWTAQAQQQNQEITYLPEPPKQPAVAPPGEKPPSEDSFWVPGNWVWQGDRYMWRPGYWGRIQPGYVWVAGHYRWTPSGYIYIQGYWDMAVANRGVLYAPIYVDPLVVQGPFVYTPVYAVPDAVVVDTLFVRPACCHYYFGDYYGPRYQTLGFESCYYYSRTNYDCIITYERWEYRHDPSWLSVRIDLTNDRYYGRAPLPPRTLVQQNTIVNQNITNVNVVNNNTTVINNKMQMIAPASQIAAAKGQKTVTVSPEARVQAKQDAQQAQQTAMVQRKQVETSSTGPLTAPKTTALKVPAARPVGTSPTQTVGSPSAGSSNGLGKQNPISNPSTGPQTNNTNMQKPVTSTNPTGNGFGTPKTGSPTVSTQPGTNQKPATTVGNPLTPPPGPGTTTRPGQPGANPLPPLTPPPGDRNPATVGQPNRPGQPPLQGQITRPGQQPPTKGGPQPKDDGKKQKSQSGGN